MRMYVTTALDLAGLAAVVAGVALWSIAAALIVGGVGMLVVSWRLSS